MSGTTLDLTAVRAGRELDARVAECVMGWRDVGGPNPPNRTWCARTARRWMAPGWPRARALPPYSTDMAAAASVMETIRDLAVVRYWTLYDGSAAGWRAVVSEDPIDGRMGIVVAEGTGDTLPLAICCAALAYAQSRSEAA